MNSKLKLYHKGLFFLSVFVVLELVFVGWLFYLLHSAEQEAQNYERSMHITKCANDLLKQYTDGAGALAFYAATGSSSYKSKYEATVAGIPAAKKELHDSIKDDPNGLAEVQELTNLLDQAGNALIAYKKEVDEQRGDLLQLRRKALPTIKRAMEALKVLLEKEAVRAEKAYPKSSKDMRERMVLVICIALAVHIAVAIFVLRYFITTITRRIDILTDNSMRLAMGKPLNPLLTGQDEIAFLDGRFHTMAEVLEEASAKERQATEAIKESEEQIRALVDHMPVGL
ncbi:MAG TPA: hypothetical protein V6C72_08230, partial [Chroococcales cyanobacterium]